MEEPEADEPPRRRGAVERRAARAEKAERRAGNLSLKT